MSYPARSKTVSQKSPQSEDWDMEQGLHNLYAWPNIDDFEGRVSSVRPRCSIYAKRSLRSTTFESNSLSPKANSPQSIPKSNWCPRSKRRSRSFRSRSGSKHSGGEVVHLEQRQFIKLREFMTSWSEEMNGLVHKTCWKKSLSYVCSLVISIVTS